MSVPQATCAVAIARCLNGQWSYCVEIKPPVVTTIQRLPQRVIEFDPSHSWDIVSWFHCPDAVGAYKHGGFAVDTTNRPTVDRGGSRLGERHKSRSGLHVAGRPAQRL